MSTNIYSKRDWYHGDIAPDGYVYNAFDDFFQSKEDFDAFVIPNGYLGVHCHTDRLLQDFNKGQMGSLVRPRNAHNVLIK